MPPMHAREWFEGAATGVVELLPGLAGRLDHPGLGVWDVRALLGHTSRALLTIEHYLDAERRCTEPELASAADYFQRARAGLADAEAVARRGVDSGAALGADPVGAVREHARRVVALVAATTDDATVTTPLGTMRLRDYLPTRAFELTVHGIDLARATGQAVPALLLERAASCLELIAGLAAPEQRLELLLAATGRASLPEGFSVV